MHHQNDDLPFLSMPAFDAFPQMLWLSFAVVWDMALFDLTSSAVEEALYLSCDFGAKVGPFLISVKRLQDVIF